MMMQRHLPLSLELPLLLLLSALLVNTVTAQSTLREAVPDGFAVGGHLHGYNYDFDNWQDYPYLVVADTEFNAVTSSIYMTWNGGPDNIDGFMNVVEWAESRSVPKRVHGHSLLYPTANVGYWQSDEFLSSDDTIKDVAERFLTNLCTAARGRVYVWDVVNEVFAHEYHNPNDVGHWGLLKTYEEYWNIDGEGDYVEWAFRKARECDPDATLILLETNAEEEGMASNSIHYYIQTMLERGVPIDGIGFQMHVWGPNDKDWDSVRRNFQRFADLGLKIFITELDVMSEGGSTNVDDDVPDTQQKIDQAAVFRQVGQLAMDFWPVVESLYLWDYADDPCWMHPSSFALGSDPVGTYYFPTPWEGGYSYMTKKTSGTDAYDFAYDGLLKGLAYRPNNDGGGGGNGNGNGGSDSVGWERLTSAWDPSTSYLGVNGQSDGNGGWTPLSDTSLFTLDANSEGWWSLQWLFEGVNDDDDGSYRIRCRWGDGYLTRGGDYDPDADRWHPNNALFVMDLEETWYSQRWYIEYAGKSDEENNGANLWRIVNAWDTDNNGYLTRNGSFNGQNYDPSNTVNLYPYNSNWSSQMWMAPDV